MVNTHGICCAFDTIKLFTYFQVIPYRGVRVLFDQVADQFISRFKGHTLRFGSLNLLPSCLIKQRPIFVGHLLGKYLSGVNAGNLLLTG